MAVFGLILCFFSQRQRVTLHTNTVVLTGPAQSVFLLPETESNFIYEYSGAHGPAQSPMEGEGIMRYC